MSRLSRHRKFSTYSSMFKKHHFENQKIRNPIYFKDASRLLGNNKATFFAQTIDIIRTWNQHPCSAAPPHLRSVHFDSLK